MHRSGEGEENWYDYTYEKDGRVDRELLAQSAGSIDQGEKSSAVYALHSLVGHHGIFSLTPIWLLSVAGTLAFGCFGRRDRASSAIGLFDRLGFGWCALIFYVFIESNGRNYGGMTCGFRWVFWFAPLWLLIMLPAVDRMATRRWTRALALVLLAISTLSAAYPSWNVWVHPWLLNYMHYLGWIQV